ncbi:MAG: hypothetical protein AVDCRST_MAG56-5383, partial [uncultured Cytophagales bacterium]
EKNIAGPAAGGLRPGARPGKTLAEARQPLQVHPALCHRAAVGHLHDRRTGPAHGGRTAGTRGRPVQLLVPAGPARVPGPALPASGLLPGRVLRQPGPRPLQRQPGGHQRRRNPRVGRVPDLENKPQRRRYAHGGLLPAAAQPGKHYGGLRGEFIRKVFLSDVHPPAPGGQGPRPHDGRKPGGHPPARPGGHPLQRGGVQQHDHGRRTRNVGPVLEPVAGGTGGLYAGRPRNEKVRHQLRHQLLQQPPGNYAGLQRLGTGPHGRVFAQRGGRRGPAHQLPQPEPRRGRAVARTDDGGRHVPGLHGARTGRLQPAAARQAVPGTGADGNGLQRTGRGAVGGPGPRVRRGPQLVPQQEGFETQPALRVAGRPRPQRLHRRSNLPQGRLPGHRVAGDFM